LIEDLFPFGKIKQGGLHRDEAYTDLCDIRGRLVVQSVDYSRTNGNNLRKLTHVGAGAWASDPAWSPDGKWIAYSLKKMVKRPNPGERVPINEVFGDGAIYVVNAIGGIGEPLEVANGLSPHPAPAWVPSDFLSVSPSAEKMTTLWGKLKDSK
jgi:hypothetical protein